MNAAQITRALSDCVNPMVVLHRVYRQMIGTGLAAVESKIVAALQLRMKKSNIDRIPSS
jgi:hypothetical protein